MDVNSYTYKLDEMCFMTLNKLHKMCDFGRLAPLCFTSLPLTFLPTHNGGGGDRSSGLYIKQ